MAYTGVRGWGGADWRTTEGERPMVCANVEPGGRQAGAIAIGVMCKAPIEGASKTRLTPPLTPAEAAALSRCFIADTVALAVTAVRELPCDVVAVHTPAGSEAQFDGVVPAGVGMLAQRGDDLSQRLINATNDLLGQGYGAVCLMNSDSPTLPTLIVRRAVETLRQAPDSLVLGPAIDGGYCLIGLSRAHDWAFKGIAWSTNTVLAETLARAAAEGVPAVCMPSWYDVDDWVSLDLLLHDVFGAGTGLCDGFSASAAGHTRDFLERLLATDGDRRRLRVPWALGPT